MVASILPDRAEQSDELLQRPGLLEPADGDRLVAGVADQALGHPTGAVVGGLEVARPRPLFVDPVVERRVLEVVRLGDRPADDRLHLVGERPVFLVATGERVGRVDSDLALQPARLAERVGDPPRGNGDEDGVRVGASPPSRPRRVTACRAFSQRSAIPPTTLPLPITVMFMVSSGELPACWVVGEVAVPGEPVLLVAGGIRPSTPWSAG